MSLNRNGTDYVETAKKSQRPTAKSLDDVERNNKLNREGPTYIEDYEKKPTQKQSLKALAGKQTA